MKQVVPSYDLDERGRLPRKKMIALAVLVCGAFVTFLNQTLVAPALPTITIDLAITTSVAQWLITAFTMMNAVMIPITAFLIDRYTTRKLFLVAMLLFFFGSVSCAVAPFFFLILMGRLLQAAGAGIIMPMVMTEIMVSYPPERRGGAMGVFGLVSAVAPTIGPTVAGVIIDHTDWRMVFFVVSALALVGMVAGFFALKATTQRPAHPDAHLDKPSLVTSVLGLSLLLFGFSLVTQPGFFTAALLAMVVGGGVFAAFVYLQLHMKEPMLDLRILKANRFTKACIISAIVQAAIMCAPLLNPIYIQTIRGFSATISGLTLMPGAILMGILNPVAGKMFDKYGVRSISLVGLVLVALSSLGLCFLNLDCSLFWVTALMCVRSGACAFVNMPITTWGLNQLANTHMNHGTSINNTLRMAAGSLGTALMMSVYTLGVNVSSNAGWAQQESLLCGYAAGYGFSTLLVVVALVITFVSVRDKAGDIHSVDPEGSRRTLLTSIMKTDVYVVRDTETIAEVMEVFVAKGISAAPIVNKKFEVVGFISDGDILRALSMSTKEYIDPIMMIMRSATEATDFDDKIETLMEQNVMTIAHLGIISVNVNDRLSEVCRVLGANGLKKVPVLDDSRHLVGVINRSDITQYALRRYAENRAAAGL